MWIRAAILVVTLGVAAAVSGPKLYKMARIKGWIPGATVTREVVVQKGVEAARRGRDDKSFWVSWVAGDVTKTWKNRERVSQEIWTELQEGDPIEVVRISGDPHPYLRNGIYADDGNMAFDILLFVFELAVAGVMFVQILVLPGRSRTNS